MGVYSELKPKNEARRNPFPLDNHFNFNTKCGGIVPIKAIPTLPSSEYKIDLKSLIRTQPLQTAAFGSFKINFDVFWSPYNDHYSSANQFIAQRLNKQHTTQPGINCIPNININDFKRVVLCAAFYDYLGSLVTSDMYGYYHDTQEFQIDIPRALFFAENYPEESMALGAIRTMDYLEYGNILPLLKMAVAAFTDYTENWTYAIPEDKELPLIFKLWAYFSAVHLNAPCAVIVPNTHNIAVEDISQFMSSVSFRPSSLASDDIINEIYTMFFGSNQAFQLFTGFDISSLISDHDFVSLWPVMSYNKAFWQFYRNEYYDISYSYFSWEGSLIHEEIEYVELFNFDDFPSTWEIDPSAASTYLRFLAMFAVKPHQYKKDLFTGVLPSTQYGNVSVATADSQFVKLVADMHSSSSVYLEKGDVYNASQGGLIAATSNATVGGVTAQRFKTDPASMISVLELRRADSMQRFKERMLRAGNNTSDIFVAHGWSEPMSEKCFDVKFLGTFDSTLDINVVSATAETGSGDEKVNLGQLAANGVSVINGSEIRFKCSDFGTLVVVLYITKDAIYDAYGVNKIHTMLEPFDFPYPELQNISLAPIVRDQLSAFRQGGNADVLGYHPQNMVYKVQSDFTHGEFYATDPCAGYGDIPVKYRQLQGIFANMVAARKDINNPKSLSFLYVQFLGHH